MTTSLEAVAARVSRGEWLQEGDAAVLAASTDLITIGMMADEVRRRVHGVDTTFVRVLELHVDAIPEAPPPATSAGEFRIVGTPASPEAASSAVAAARQVAGETYLSGFLLHELEGFHLQSPSLFTELKAAGLDGIAAVLLDAGSPGTVDAARAAGLLVQRLVVGSAGRDAATVPASARQLQATIGGFRAFAPLPRTMSIAAPTTGYDDVKLVAIARMMVAEIPSIQVDWPLYGPKLAQVALTMGADDVDGVAAVEQGTLGTRRSAIEEIRGNIRAAGLQPVERDGRFQVLAD